MRSLKAFGERIAARDPDRCGRITREDLVSNLCKLTRRRRKKSRRRQDDLGAIAAIAQFLPATQTVCGQDKGRDQKVVIRSMQIEPVQHNDPPRKMHRRHAIRLLHQPDFQL
jgi:hypothetical protein